MNILRKSCNLALVAALLSFSLEVSAVSLGRLRGTALLGQPLEVLANIQFAGDEVVAADCLEATVSYGNTQLPSGQVLVTVLAGTEGQSVPVAIRASAVVDEPLVTVTFSAGCLQRATRRYVLLSELTSEILPASTAPLVERPRVPDGAVSLSAQAQAVAKPPAIAQHGVSEPKPRRAQKKSVHALAGNGKLKLDLPEKHADTPATKADLSPSEQASIDELTRRVEALSERKAARETGGEMPESDASFAALQQSVKALQVVTGKNSKDLQRVSGALDASESHRVGVTWLYGLVALVCLALTVLAWSVWRVRRSGHAAAPWWGIAQAPEPETVVLAPSSHGHVNAPLAQPLDSVDIDLDGAMTQTVVRTDNAPAIATPSEIKRNDKRDFAPSGSANLRAINTKEMFDVRQQAEFFMALGQHDEAIQVLEQSNLESEESNPLVLLDLLKILHTLSRRGEFERYRAEFNLLFTGMVPNYANFTAEGKGLDSYPDIIQQVENLWPSDDALDYLERCMVRTSEDDAGQGFDLEAFRDLLTLHAVLRRLDTAGLDSNLTPFSANRTMSSPLSEDSQYASTESKVPSNADTAPLPSLQYAPETKDVAPALDLDLTNDGSTNLIEFDVNGLSGFNKPKE